MKQDDGSHSVTWLWWIRPLLLLAIIGFMVFAYFQWGNELTLDRLAQRQQALRLSLSNDPVPVLACAFLIYVFVTAAFIGSATAISLLYGWLFGMIVGTILVSFASTTGATLTFLASRYLFRSEMERRFAARVQLVDAAFAKSGTMYLLSLRLIPGLPFFLVNVLMGLTPIRLKTYWWVSQLGMLPATLIFVYAGSTVPDLATLNARGVSSILSGRFILALLLLSLLPLMLAALRRTKWFGPSTLS